MFRSPARYAGKAQKLLHSCRLLYAKAWRVSSLIFTIYLFIVVLRVRTHHSQTMPEHHLSSARRVRIFFILACVSLVLYFLMQNSAILTVAAGVALFLFAMLVMERSFKILSDGLLDKFLRMVANRNAKSFLFGFSLSTLVQSSGLVTVIVVSFLSAGLMSLSCGVSMIYGVNLSSAITTWFVSYFGLKAQISLYAMPLFIVGMMLCWHKERQLKGLGLFLLAIGLLFLGLSWMKTGFEVFKDTLDLSRFGLPGFRGLLIYTLIGFCVTGITQSSHATLTLAVTALTVGQISYENAIGIAIGDSVGSTIITLISAARTNNEGKKIALVHVLFKLVCAFVALAFIRYYLGAVDYLTPILGFDASDDVYRLAIFTSIFNIVGVVLLVPFIEPMCRFLNYILAYHEEKSDQLQPKYLNESSLAYAPSALKALQQECNRLLDNTMDVTAILSCVQPWDIASGEHAHLIIANQTEPICVNAQELYYQRFKGLYSAIVDYAVQMTSSAGLNKEIANEVMELRRACVIMGSAMKKAQQLQVNMIRLGFGKDPDIRREYAHIRRNLIRLFRLVNALRTAQNKQEAQDILRRLSEHKNKFDAITSRSLDRLIREHLISDSDATSIMNDYALARSISKNLKHVAVILSTQIPEYEHEDEG